MKDRKAVRCPQSKLELENKGLDPLRLPCSPHLFNVLKMAPQVGFERAEAALSAHGGKSAAAATL
jgi:hypothetical protein